MLRSLVVIVLSALVGTPLAVSEKKRPVGPVPEGTVFSGRFRSWSLQADGTKNLVADLHFDLTIDSIDGQDFVGKWNFGTSCVLRVEGKITKKGNISFTFTKLLVGRGLPQNPQKVVGAQVDGVVGAKTIDARYTRPSGNFVAFIKGEVLKAK